MHRLVLSPQEEAQAPLSCSPTSRGSSPVRDGTARLDGSGREHAGSAPARRCVGQTPAGPQCPPLWEQCTECNWFMDQRRLRGPAAAVAQVRVQTVPVASAGSCPRHARACRAGLRRRRRAACPADTRPRGSSPSEEEKVLQSWAIKAIS